MQLFFGGPCTCPVQEMQHERNSYVSRKVDVCDFATLVMLFDLKLPFLGGHCLFFSYIWLEIDNVILFAFFTITLYNLVKSVPLGVKGIFRICYNYYTVMYFGKWIMVITKTQKCWKLKTWQYLATSDEIHQNVKENVKISIGYHVSICSHQNVLRGALPGSLHEVTL